MNASALLKETDGPNWNYRWPELAPETRWLSAADVTIGPLQTWLSKALRRIATIQKLHDNWNSYGAESPNFKAAQMARVALQMLEEADCKPSQIDPSADGGICIAFEAEGMFADVECFNTGEILASVSKDGEEADIWAIGDERDLAEAINKIRANLIA
jgi:hypothetical protein